MKFFLIILLLLNFSCKNKEHEYTIIRGRLDNLHSNKLYIAKVPQFEIPIDSFNVKDGIIYYKKNWTKNEHPFLAYLMYKDSLTGKLRDLEFLNPFLSDFVKDTPIVAFDAFMLAKEEITINGKVSGQPHYIKGDSIFLKGSHQTDAYFESGLADFGFLNSSLRPERNNRIKYFKGLIEKYPDSWYYLDCILVNASSYSNNELSSFLNLFDKTLRFSQTGKSVNTFMQSRNKVDSNLVNYEALTPENTLQKILDTTCSLNIVSFWASWCGPCFNEIEMNKKLLPIYKGNNIKLSQVSIDESDQQWKASLERFKMKWPQYHVQPKKLKLVNIQFGFSYIPTVIFYDKKGKEIVRFTGYDSTMEEKILQSLVPYLKK